MCDAKVLSDVRADLGNCSGEFGVIGEALFLRMFRERPAVQDNFPKYKGQTVDKLKSSGLLSAHGKKVVELLVKLVENADKPALTQMVNDFIALHKKYSIPYDILKATKSEVVATLGEYGMKSGSWGPFLDFFFTAIAY